jgi:putative oxidoreductase
MVAHYRPGDAGQMIHFMKNVCMAGGFLQVVAFGAGRFSADRR